MVYVCVCIYPPAGPYQDVGPWGGLWPYIYNICIYYMYILYIYIYMCFSSGQIMHITWYIWVSYEPFYFCPKKKGWPILLGDWVIGWPIGSHATRDPETKVAPKWRAPGNGDSYWKPSFNWGLIGITRDPETNSKFAPENGWLEYFCFLLGWPIFRCELLVLESVKINHSWTSCR